MWLKVIGVSYDEWFNPDCVIGVRIVKLVKTKKQEEKWKAVVILPMMGACDMWEGDTREGAVKALGKVGWGE